MRMGWSFALLAGVILILGGMHQVAVHAALPEPPALVRIDLRTSPDLDYVAASGVPVLARLFSADGREYLLALADPGQKEELVHLGLSLRVLDPDSHDATYYLLYAPQPEALHQARARVAILHEDGRQTLARATPAQAERLLKLGVELRRIGPHPLVLGLEKEAPALPTAITPNPLVQEMIAQVQTTTVYSYDGSLSGEWPVIIGGSPYTIATRYSRTTTPIEKATQYTYEHFQALGLPVQYHYYNLPGTGTRRNVVAEQTGLSEPDRIFLITAHVDDTSGIPYAWAPGADDNASGSTGVLIAADILSQYDFGCTLRYVLFTGEEQGLYGSAAYAADVYANSDDIEGVLNLDMIGYNSDAYPIIELHTRPGNVDDLAIANMFADVVNAYSINLTPEIVQDGIQASDHASFWNYGYPAILGIEDFEDFTPYYHTTGDQLESLDLTYFSDFVKAAVGTFVHMGCLLEPSGHLSGVVSDAGAGTPIISATVRAILNPTQTWSTTTEAGGGYQLVVLSGTYTVTASAAGYIPYLTSGVTVTADSTTTLNIALSPVPTYVISGHVQDAHTGLPLSATLSLPGSPITPTQTDPTTGFYSLTVPADSYTVWAEAAGYHPQSRPITVTADRTEDFDLEPLCLLLVVDDDEGLNHETYYTGALDRLGFSYDTTTSPPDAATLAYYQGVIWLTGDDRDTTLTTADRSNLATYLDAGGRLFLSGQDLGFDIGETAFYTGYLHATFDSDDTDIYTLTGLDFLIGLDVTIVGGDGANNQLHPSDVLPVGDGVAVYDYPTPHLYGGVAYSGIYRTVYFSFGYEAIHSQADRDAVMSGTLTYLGVCEPVEGPVAGFSSSSPDRLGETTVFTNTTTGTPPLSFTWDFGDGSLAVTDMSPTHVYTAPGVYTVVMTAANTQGTDMATGTVKIVDYGVVMVPVPAAQATAPGTTVTYTLHLTNTGSVADVYTITLSGNAWNTHLSATTLTLTAGGTHALTVRVTVPLTATEGMSDTVRVQALGAGVADSSDLTTIAIWPHKTYLPAVLGSYP